MIVDNMLWHGQIFDPKDQRADTETIRELTRRVTADATWAACVIPIRDGLLVAYKRSNRSTHRRTLRHRGS